MDKGNQIIEIGPFIIVQCAENSIKIYSEDIMGVMPQTNNSIIIVSKI